jgi:protein-S-isoprenylcysteine O-methyltransferase Ste14
MRIALDSPGGEVIGWLWGAWLVYWVVAAAGTKATARHETSSSRLSHAIPVVIGLALLLGHKMPVLSFRVLPSAVGLTWMAVALVAVGLAFSVWARWYLAGNWSATVTVKQAHELIRGGPYAWVRHPIYTGIITAVLGTALAVGEARALLGFAFITAGFVRKLHIEEAWMAQVFGDQYARYRSEVAALIPFIY